MSTPQLPGPTSVQKITGKDVDTLKAVFLRLAESRIQHALVYHGSVEAAAGALSEFSSQGSAKSTLLGDEQVTVIDDEQSTIKDDDQLTAPEILLKLKEQMTQFPQKLKIDQEDLLSDALYFYKDPDFNPRVGLQICLHGAGTRAVDTGGVLRQFYSDLFIALAENKEMTSSKVTQSGG